MEKTPLFIFIDTWDYKQQPDWNCISRGTNALIKKLNPEKLTAKGNRLYYYEVDSGGDDFALLISTRKLTQPQAQKHYEKWYRSIKLPDYFLTFDQDENEETQ